MVRTAEYLARDFVLDFTLGSIMSYERDRLTLELLNTHNGKLLD